jgi:hypothetical protein
LEFLCEKPILFAIDRNTMSDTLRKDYRYPYVEAIKNRLLIRETLYDCWDELKMGNDSLLE